MKSVAQTLLCGFILAGSLFTCPAQSAGPLLKLERRTDTFDLTVSSLSATGALFIFQATNLQALVDSPSLLFETNNATTNDVSLPLTPSGALAKQAFFSGALWPGDSGVVGMVFIPAGSFTMGNTFSATEGYSQELPAHTVYVSGFCMDKYDVTKALWDGVYDWAQAHGYSFEYGAQGKAANHPAHSMTWYDAVKWCNARSEKEGRTPAYYTSAAQTIVYRAGQLDLQNDWVKWNAAYRLPTEAEWEKAARGGASGHRFPWSDTDNIDQSRANYYSYWSGAAPYPPYDVNATSGFHPTFNDGIDPYTSPVGYFAANGYGLYDMAGNVWEWCWDWHGDSYYSSSPGTDPAGPASGSYRVFRGGSWGDGAYGARCAFRHRDYPGLRYNGLGIRCVLLGASAR